MSIEDDILIERFLRNELSDSERTSFLARMESDASFKEQVILEKHLLQVLGNSYWSFARNDRNARVLAYQKLLESDEAQQLKASIAETIAGHKRESTTVSSNRTYDLKFSMRVAAVLALFFVSIFWFFSNNETINRATATQQAWNKNVGLDFTVRSNPSDAVKITLEKALQYYTHKKYDSTLTILKPYPSSTVHYKDVLLLRALSYYRLQQPQAALTTLDSLTTYAPDISKWYQGLIYLDQNQPEKAKLFLELPSQTNQEIKLKN